MKRTLLLELTLWIRLMNMGVKLPKIIMKRVNYLAEIESRLNG